MRGLGAIPDAAWPSARPINPLTRRRNFRFPALRSEEIKGVFLRDILRGVKSPEECPLFRCACTPLNPIAPAWFHRRDLRRLYQYH